MNIFPPSAEMLLNFPQRRNALINLFFYSPFQVKLFGFHKFKWLYRIQLKFPVARARGFSSRVTETYLIRANKCIFRETSVRFLRIVLLLRYNSRGYFFARPFSLRGLFLLSRGIFLLGGGGGNKALMGAKWGLQSNEA